MEESVYDHNLEEIELRSLGISHINKELYLLNTTPSKRLGDLYMLFSMRLDKGNCKRIADDIISLTSVKKRDN